MELLAVLYTFLLVTICLLLALMLYRTAKPTANRDDAALKEWLRQQLDAQNQQMEAKLAEMSRQNLAAMGQISEALQSSVQSMSAALTAGQGTQQQTMEQRLQGLEASNARISPRPLYTCSSWSLTALKLSVTRFCRASCSCSSTV